MKKQKGQALVVLLFYMIVAIMLTTTAIMLSISNSMATMQEEEGGHALEIAESGAENALIRILRDTNYPGETLTVDGGSVTVSVSGGTLKTITAVGSKGSFSRSVLVTASIQNGVLTLVSWQEQ